jgi:hypothetical protein
VARDHYAILGVSPTSEDVVIRAAYRALMRRYHPDADPSSEASQRAQAINAAYAVLGDPDKRARYDGSLAAQGLIKPDAPHRSSLARRMMPGPAGLIGLAGLAAAAALIAISPPVGVLPEDALPFSEPRAGRSAVDAMAVAPPSKAAANLCGNPAVPGLIKSELLRQAAVMRGADREQIERIGPYSLLRLDSPASRSQAGSGAAGCSAGAALDLPPGLAVDGGRTNLNAQLVYGVSESGRGLRLASLSGAGRLVRSLATLAPAPSEPQPEVEAIRPDLLAEAKPIPELPRPGSSRADVRPPREVALAAARTAATRTAVSSPSKPTASDCSLGDGWADRAICDSSNLTALDRQHSLLYAQSWAKADQAKRAALLGSRERFREIRNGCRSQGCLTGAYVARLREISDIMARDVQH